MELMKFLLEIDPPMDPLSLAPHEIDVVSRTFPSMRVLKLNGQTKLDEGIICGLVRLAHRAIFKTQFKLIEPVSDALIQQAKDMFPHVADDQLKTYPALASIRAGDFRDGVAIAYLVIELGVDGVRGSLKPGLDSINPDAQPVDQPQETTTAQESSDDNAEPASIFEFLKYATDNKAILEVTISSYSLKGNQLLVANLTVVPCILQDLNDLLDSICYTCSSGEVITKNNVLIRGGKESCLQIILPV